MGIEETLRRAYAASLALYPAEFCSRFGAEMKRVFCEALADARADGWGSVPRLIGREIELCRVHGCGSTGGLGRIRRRI